MELTLVMKKFIMDWGQMGSRWGINRTVAQVHALLYISSKPLNADEIMECLDVARSNVSSSLKELLSWGIIRVVHVSGDRKEYFESLQDVWEMYRIVLDQRKKWEIDPTLAFTKESLLIAQKDGKKDPETEKKLKELVDFFETMTAWYENLRKVPLGKIIKLVNVNKAD